MQNIIYAVCWLGGMGALFGCLIATFSKVFAVKTDVKVDKVLEALPGINCGGCGFAGCATLANAIVKGDAHTNACPVGGAEVAKNVAKVMGVKEENFVPMVAKVKCRGTNDNAKTKYIYEGIEDCVAAKALAGGDKICAFACMGLGTCVRACRFGAIEVIDGVAVVDKEKCTNCGRCAKVCPKDVISLVPKNEGAFVQCNSQNVGQIVRQICEVGCIGCGICVKTCPVDAISVEDNIAVIDRGKCNNCGACIAKCPRKIIDNE